MTSLKRTLHLAILSVAGRLTANWVQGTWERGMRPGEISGRASHPTTQFHATPSVVQEPTQELCAKSSWAEGLLGSERQGKVCRDFKVIPRSACLRHRGATHGSPTVPPRQSWPTWRTLPRSQSLWTPSSRGLVPRATGSLRNRVHQEASSPLQSTPERFRGKGNHSTPGGASPQSSAQICGLLSPEAVSRTFRLDFLVVVERK
ncbi:hypothetical protein HJG60_011189 [Phyllostomus discolor]|uniref:Uncharacterized protein n=1 Tax=Phyllostomus discolor TaxID=89673 RepID=A0A834E535_9CHIR|nr:hypothetical protein HJG60_011189 [Phyllostomus discolor]